MNLGDLKTPALILDRGRLARNVAAMTRRMKTRGVALRPHLKTAKSDRIARFAVAGNFGGITVSTVAEAVYFANAGFADITYAVGMVPAKLQELAPLIRDGLVVTLIADDLEAVGALDARAGELGVVPRLLVEIDTGLGRAGVAPDEPALLALARAIHAARHLELAGVLTHAGHSYHCRGAPAVRAVAEEERAGLVRAAERLRAAGLPCPIISGGSTPTAVHAADLTGVTEMRPGNYMFYDLDQVGIGTCVVEDVAVSVLATVIGHNRRAGTALLDAGALALSKDVSAGEFFDDVGYGWVFDRLGRARLAGAWVGDVHQEHGIVRAPDGAPFDAMPIGARVRVLPNHSCMTCAMYDTYYVVDGGDALVDSWPRINGW